MIVDVLQKKYNPVHPSLQNKELVVLLSPHFFQNFFLFVTNQVATCTYFPPVLVAYLKRYIHFEYWHH